MSELLIKQLQETIEKQQRVIEELKATLSNGEHPSVFKIRNLETGLYSTGGAYAAFNKKGKTWETKGGALSHLGQYISGYKAGQTRAVSYVEGCELIELVTIEKSCQLLRDNLLERQKI